MIEEVWEEMKLNGWIGEAETRSLVSRRSIQITKLYFDSTHTHTHTHALTHTHAHTTNEPISIFKPHQNKFYTIQSPPAWPIYRHDLQLSNLLLSFTSVCWSFASLLSSLCLLFLITFFINVAEIVKAYVLLTPLSCLCFGFDAKEITRITAWSFVQSDGFKNTYWICLLFLVIELSDVGDVTQVALDQSDYNDVLGSLDSIIYSSSSIVPWLDTVKHVETILFKTK